MRNIGQVQRYFQAWIDRNADAILATFRDGGTYQDPTTGGPIRDVALRENVGGLWSAFPDLTFAEESIGEIGPDRVAAQWVMRGTNIGSMRGLPPTGRSVELRGVDFIELRDGKIQTVTGYFDSGEIPRQLGLDIVVQPKQVGPFVFGVSIGVQTGKTTEPGAFSITSLEARDDQTVLQVREASRASILDMLKIDGFIGAVIAVIGHRMVTISAWDNAETPRQVMHQGAHVSAVKRFHDGLLADHGFTGVWTKQRMSPIHVRCDSCGTMNHDPGADRMCSCGAKLPGPRPFW
jgi:steroid delta-isomerase-like uncharacterized protein